MPSKLLESRVEKLEKQMQQLAAERAAALPPATNKEWVLSMWGSFADDPAFLQAMTYAKKWRNAQRPKPSSQRKKHLKNTK